MPGQPSKATIYFIKAYEILEKKKKKTPKEYQTTNKLIVCMCEGVVGGWSDYLRNENKKLQTTFCEHGYGIIITNS